MRQLFVVIPAYNEAAGILRAVGAVDEALDKLENIEATILVVNDGSTDGMVPVLSGARLEFPRLRYLSFNMNCGKEAAIYAGLKVSSEADAVVVIDADLQHPPALISTMVEYWLQGHLVVEGYRTSNAKEGSSVASKIFYKVFSSLTALDLREHCDFKLLDKQVVAEYVRLPESDRFFRGLVRWMSFDSKQVPFEVPARTVGMTAWSNVSLIRYAVSTITSFSSLPLQLVSILGVITLIISVAFGVMTVHDKLVGDAVDGFATVIILMSFFSSVLMFSLGLIGVYISKIYNEVKRRPSYMVNWKQSSEGLKDECS